MTKANPNFTVHHSIIVAVLLLGLILIQSCAPTQIHLMQGKWMGGLWYEDQKWKISAVSTELADSIVEFRFSVDRLPCNGLIDATCRAQVELKANQDTFLVYIPCIASSEPIAFKSTYNRDLRRIQGSYSMHGFALSEFQLQYQTSPSDSIIPSFETRPDFANVYWDSTFTLFDLETGKPIRPKLDAAGRPVYDFFYTSNENPCVFEKEGFSAQALEGHLFYKFETRRSCLKFLKRINKHKDCK